MDMTTPRAGRPRTAVADRPFDWAEDEDQVSPHGGPRAENLGSGGHAPRHGRARRSLPGSKRTWWLVAVGVVVVLLTPSAWSYGQALAAPGNTALTVRSVDWLRDHHLRWLVNDVENFWYNHHKPKKGGAPTGKLAQTFDQGVAAGPSGGSSTAGQGGSAPTPKHLPAPAPIQPIVAPPIAGEGHWQPLGQPVQGVPAMYAAYVRPDPVYTSLVTGIAWVDPTLVRAVLYAGVMEPPGGQGLQHQGSVAPADRPNLLAAFNSGFKLNDSKGGYYAEGRMVRALRPGVATLLIRGDGTPTVGVLGRDFQMGPDVAFARQNLSLIVDNGQPVPDISANNPAKWGATLGNKVLV
jgi:hypothetical protein